MSSKLTPHEMSQLTIDLSTLELKDIISKLELFIEVLPWNCVPYFRKNYPTAIIINIDDSYSQGTHWCALLFPTSSSPVEYFDSFGRPPPTQLCTEEMKRFGYIHNPIALQHPLTSVCGYYCVYYFIKRMLYHQTMDAILLPMSGQNKLLNDYKVMEYVIQSSA
jgi:hypothetical protein